MISTSIHFQNYRLNPHVNLEESVKRILDMCNQRPDYHVLYPLLQLYSSLKLYNRAEFRDLTVQVRKAMVQIYKHASEAQRKAVARRFTEFFPLTPSLTQVIEDEDKIFYTDLGPCKLDVHYTAVYSNRKILYPWGHAFIPNQNDGTIRTIDPHPHKPILTNMGMATEQRLFEPRKDGMKLYDLGWGKMYSSDDFTRFEKRSVSTNSHKNLVPTTSLLSSCTIQ